MPTVKELIQVPPELVEFAQQPSFHSTLLSVRDQSSINYICVNRNHDTGGLQILIDANTPERAGIARRLIELHFKQQFKLMQSEARLKRIQTDLFSVQGDVASGLIIEFNVPVDLLGMIIGKKGARLQKVIQDTHVKNIQINGKTGRVVITGSDQESVQAAKELVDLEQTKYPLSDVHFEYFSREKTALSEIRESCELVGVQLGDHELILIGTKSGISMTSALMPTQLEYIDRQLEIESRETDLRKQLIGFKKTYSLSSAKEPRKPSVRTGRPADESPRLRRSEEDDLIGAKDESTHDVPNPVSLVPQSKAINGSSQPSKPGKRRAPSTRGTSDNEGRSSADGIPSSAPTITSPRTPSSRDKVSSLFAFSQEVFESLPTLNMATKQHSVPSTLRRQHESTPIDDITSSELKADAASMSEIHSHAKPRARGRGSRGNAQL